jgi:hypothetical protein
MNAQSSRPLAPLSFNSATLEAAVSDDGGIGQLNFKNEQTVQVSSLSRAASHPNPINHHRRADPSEENKKSFCKKIHAKANIDEEGRDNNNNPSFGCSALDLRAHVVSPAAPPSAT